MGETFATPRHADSEREVERVLSVIARREERWRAYEELGANAHIDLSPTEIWALARLGELEPATPEAVTAATGVDDARLDRALGELERRGLVEETHGAYSFTPDGRRAYDAVVSVRRATLEELVRDWSPEDHAQLRRARQVGPVARQRDADTGLTEALRSIAWRSIHAWTSATFIEGERHRPCAPVLSRHPRLPGVQRYGDQAAFISAGGYHHHRPEHVGVERRVTSATGTTGLYHVAIRYPDRKALGQALKQLVEAGVPIGDATDHGVSEAISLRDPDDNGIELYRDRPEEEWPRAEDGSMSMVSEPLDLRALLAEAE